MAWQLPIFVVAKSHCHEKHNIHPLYASCWFACLQKGPYTL